MYFWLKLLHIAAMTVWFTGLFFLPRLLLARTAAGTAQAVPEAEGLGRVLYFGVMTPGAVTTILLGTALLAYGATGAWLPGKLALVAVAVLLHVYLGQLLLDPRRAGNPAPASFCRVLSWLPLLLLLGIAALTAGKPARLLLPGMP